MKKIGFFGGSFDPIHFGHIGLAVDLLEKYHLDEILFCPTFCSPFKTDNPPKETAFHRLKMVELALDHPQFKICTLEIYRQGPSYTIDTLRELKGLDLRLLLSEESARNLSRWRDYEEIIQLAPPLIGARENKISSTEIRERLKKRLYCSHLIPAKALDYIMENALYS